MFKIALLVLLIGGGLFALDRLFLFMENRGWICYRQRKTSSSALSNACLEIQQLLEPSKKYIVQIKKEQKVEAEESGSLNQEDPALENQENYEKDLAKE
ncbi:MAG: hypothetical protein ACPLZD_00675 [Candidatus Saccharicenans sp.]